MTDMSSKIQTATPGKVLAKNTLFNLIGSAVPVIVALFSIPMLMKGLGTERFGVLMLSWMVVGYFGLFDLGVGRATTKFAADCSARGDMAALASLVWSSTILLFCFGSLGGLLLAAGNAFLVSTLLKIPTFLIDETVSSFYLLAGAIPVVLSTAGMRGILEAQQRFGLINAVKIPVSAASFCAPLLVIPFSNSLFPIIGLLLLLRILEFLTYTLLCLKSVPGIIRPQPPNMNDVKRLLGFGGWLTVSNIISPLMSYLDRFVVGILLTMSAVAYYATPYDLVMKLGIIPGSVLGVMFPELSATLITGSDRFPVLYDQSIRFILFMLAPVTLGIIVLAEPLLTLWLGREFAVHSTLVLQILAVGIYVNSASQVPYTAIQAIGRPDITAKLHILELPFYMVAIVFLIIKMGIIGAALAWLLRVLIDTLLLFRCAHRFIPSLSRQSGRLNTSMTIITGYLILSLCITQFLPGLMFRVFLLIALITVLLTYIWRVSLEPDEKRELMFIVANCGRLVGISTAR